MLLSVVRAFFSFSRNILRRLHVPTAGGELIAISSAPDNHEVSNPIDMENRQL
jgi:hypothetical protein